jgi:hypothetical protein
MENTPRIFRHFDKKMAFLWQGPSGQFAKMKILKSELGGLPNLVSANTQNQARREPLAIKLKTEYFSFGPAGEDKN